MSEQSEDTGLVSKLLESQQALLQQLQQTLEQEQQSLSSRDADALARLSQIKQQQSDELEQLASEFHSWLAARHVSADADSLKQFMQQLGLQQLWQSYLEQLQTCQKLNAISGKVVEQSMHINNRILNVLLGQGQANTYSASGEIKHGDQNNTLIKA